MKGFTIKFRGYKSHQDIAMFPTVIVHKGYKEIEITFAFLHWAKEVSIYKLAPTSMA